jgi:hypothetical protein
LIGHSVSEETRKKVGLAFKGKTWEKIMGVEKANERKNQQSQKWSNGEMALEKNPSWRGGISFEPYDRAFNNKFKREIRKRDNYVCVVCNIHQEKLKKALGVHHINYNKQLSIPQNCVSLCKNCHTKTNFNREHWIAFFQSALTKRFGYSYSNEKEIILEFGGKYK